MKEDLIRRLLALNIKNVQVEKELDLPTNSLSAVLKGHKPMPDKWVEGVEEYLRIKEPPPLPSEPPKPIKDITRPWIEEIEAYCLTKGLYPDQLIEFHKLHSNSSTVKAIQLLQKGIESTKPTETRKMINSGDKSKEMYEPPEGSRAHLLRYGAYYKKDIQK